MPTLISILNGSDKKTFDAPPVFTEDERAAFFELPQWAAEFAATLRSPSSLTGFVLTVGYFRADNKFFDPDRFHDTDIDFVVRAFGLKKRQVRMDRYKDTTQRRHKTLILKSSGFRRFDGKSKRLIAREAKALARKQMQPRSIFMSLVDFLRSKKIEVPGYQALAESIARAVQAMEQDLHASISRHLSDEHKQLLKSLLEKKDDLSGENGDPKMKRYKITLLKKSSQSTKPSKIRENVADLDCLKDIFDELGPVINSINLSPETIQYYGRVVVKSQVFQLKRRNDKKYLYLLAFVIHQYYRLNDLLGDAILQSVQGAVNAASREHKEQIFRERITKQLALKTLLRKMNSHLSKVKEIERIIAADDLSDAEKIKSIKSLLESQDERKQIEEQMRSMEREANRIIKDNDYYDILNGKSLRLQNRVSPIVKALAFDACESADEITQAIDYFKQRDGNIDSNAPLDFLGSDERKLVFDSAGKLRVSLYKVMFFQHVANAIKSGALNLKHSFKYRPFEHYLIPKALWQSIKEELLERAGLKGFENFSELIPKIERALNGQFAETNKNIQSGQNKYAKIDKKGILTVSTPKKDKTAHDPVTELFPKDRVIPVFEVLSTIDKLSRFTDSLEHHQIKDVRKVPPSNVFYAGITGLGCNHGIGRISKISRHINQNELEHAVNWHFSGDNLIRANDKVLQLTQRLPLHKLLKRSPAETHTSSDGQKYNIHVESLNANYSFKYFGQKKGVTVYVFIDESHKLFYSVVISSAESEAAYVIDGLMHNEVVQSSIHSTDTAGYSEVIFGVCNLLGIAFAPRIKNFRKQQLYSFEKRSKLKAKGYDILPSKRINLGLILENWDDILRFIATIKLRETPASQLFRRLSSYSRQHPLYAALKEYGKIIKTLFLLKYIDDLELRQAIEKQLNKQENSNKFGKAVFHGNNREFRQGTKEEQMIAEGCKRLIENCIICWNYLYLSQLIFDAESNGDRAHIIDTIKNGSVVTWQHINMQGEYNFSDDYLKDALEFGIDDLLALQIA
jgi:TnpA family transposase